MGRMQVYNTVSLEGQHYLTDAKSCSSRVYGKQGDHEVSNKPSFFLSYHVPFCIIHVALPPKYFDQETQEKGEGRTRMGMFNQDGTHTNSHNMQQLQRMGVHTLQAAFNLTCCEAIISSWAAIGGEGWQYRHWSRRQPPLVKSRHTVTVESRFKRTQGSEEDGKHRKMLGIHFVVGLQGKGKHVNHPCELKHTYGRGLMHCYSVSDKYKYVNKVESMVHTHHYGFYYPPGCTKGHICTVQCPLRNSGQIWSRSVMVPQGVNMATGRKAGGAGVANTCRSFPNTGNEAGIVQGKV